MRVDRNVAGGEELAVVEQHDDQRVRAPSSQGPVVGAAALAESPALAVRREGRGVTMIAASWIAFSPNGSVEPATFQSRSRSAKVTGTTTSYPAAARRSTTRCVGGSVGRDSYTATRHTDPAVVPHEVRHMVGQRRRLRLDVAVDEVLAGGSRGLAGGGPSWPWTSPRRSRRHRRLAA